MVGDTPAPAVDLVVTYPHLSPRGNNLLYLTQVVHSHQVPPHTHTHRRGCVTRTCPHMWLFDLQVACAVSQWKNPQKINPEVVFPDPLKETLSDFLLVSETPYSFTRRTPGRSVRAPGAGVFPRDVNRPTNAAICRAGLQEPQLRLLQVRHPRKRQQPGERQLQGVEADLHQGEPGSALSVSSTWKSTLMERRRWGNGCLSSQGEFSSVYMTVSASLSVGKSQLFELSSSNRIVSLSRDAPAQMWNSASRLCACSSGYHPGLQGDFRGNPDLDHHHQHPDRNPDPSAGHLCPLEGNAAFLVTEDQK